MERAAALDTNVINWASPVPSFGALRHAGLATVGLNPSNREFVDEMGQELAGQARRFHTLASLGLDSWLDADVRHLRQIAKSCSEYFAGNPYDAWFKPLDYVVSGAGGTFYGPKANACHLDLIPFATERKWTELTSRQRSKLLSIASDALALLVRDSGIRIIILNGRSVLEQFELMAGIRLHRENIPEWTLRRRSGRDVVGFGCRGTAGALCGVPLQQDLVILGYNHNLQSSFGVTRGVVNAIRGWLVHASREARETSRS